jgi:hypothetical protein
MVVAGIGLVALLTAVQSGAKPKIQTGPAAEITHDGLTRVDRSVMDLAWVKADLDLHGYDKLMLAGVEMAFREVDAKGGYYRPGRSDQTEFPISAESRAKLREVFGQTFREELGKSKRYTLTDKPGPGVLVLVGTLIDIVSAVPPDNAPGRYEVYLRSVGEATLVLELRDSVTNEVLARVADRRAAATAGYPINANPVTAWSEVGRLARSWATLLRNRLDQVTTVGEM